MLRSTYKEAQKTQKASYDRQARHHSQGSCLKSSGGHTPPTLLEPRPYIALRKLGSVTNEIHHSLLVTEVDSEGEEESTLADLNQVAKPALDHVSAIPTKLSLVFHKVSKLFAGNPGRAVLVHPSEGQDTGFVSSLAAKLLKKVEKIQRLVVIKPS